MSDQGFVIKPLAQAITAAVLLTSTMSVSHAEEASLQLEEVIVTAQKRVENLQDVPVSVTAVSADKMYEAGIDRLEGLQTYVPNLTMTETGIGTNIYIRGIGSGINQGFEQSVGMYVDGIYHGRAQLTRAPFLDLERVEVLRGPQMILFGKNSIAGAIDLHTAKPTTDFEGQVTASYEPEYGSKELTAVVSGPLTSNIGGRLAVRQFETDGYIENLTSGKDEPSRDEQSVRGTLAVAFSDQLQATLKLQHDRFDNKGRQVEILTANPSPLPARGGLTYGEFLAGAFGQDASVLNEQLDHQRSSNGDASDNEVTSVALQFDYSFDNDSQLTLISGYLGYNYDEMCDCDFTGADIFTLQSQEDYKQFSQELRFSSALGQPVEYIVGGYLQHSELDFNDNFRISNSSVMGPVFEQAYAESDEGGPGFGQAILGTSSPRELKQDATEWSLFAQATWNINDRFRAIAGGRYSEEKKEAEKTLQFRLLDGSAMTDLVQIGKSRVVFNNSFQVYEMDLKDDRKKSHFAPMVTLQYDMSDDVMGYVSLASGFKSGGFDARSNSAPDSTAAGVFEFDDEEALSFEAGFKSRLLDGRATLNAAVFRTEYDDLQVSVFDGALGFNVGNAAGAVSQGIELDGRIRATEYLTFGSSIAYLDFEFDDYDSGTCKAFETPTAADGRNCNMDGATNQYVSPWTVNLMTEYARPIADSGLEFLANLDLLFKDSYYTAGSLEEDTKQGAYTLINARLGVGAEDGSWDVALVGKNLSDREVVSYSADTPLAKTLGFKSQYGFVEAPRTIALQGAYRF